MYQYVEWFFIGLVLILQLVVAFKFLRGRFGKVKTVKARVVDKHTVESFSKYSGNGKHIRYVVVFEIEGKKKGFYVSQFSYGGYRRNEKGTLKYQGDRLLDFQ